MKSRMRYTEDILFDNYMVSSYGEEYVHSQIPFYFEKDLYDKIVYYSETINNLAMRVMDNINGSHIKVLEYFENFPLKEKIFGLKCSLSPMYWTRYDTFIDEEGNVKFSEFNYDKPCGQKEIDLAGKLEFEGNINRGFIDKLIDELLLISRQYSNEEKINVGFLMDPCHYEELHHSYYFKHILKDTNINIVQAGPNNLSVIDGDVYAYSKIKLDIILRLFPTEFFYEINNIEKLLEAFNNGKVLIINDPRIIAVQAKGFFAYLWNLVKNESTLISNEEKEVIKKCIPYTEIFDISKKEKVLKNKDSIVLKSSLGRYSQEVYIGKTYTDEKWRKQIDYIIKSSKIHIIQDLINIRRDYTYAPDIKGMNIPICAYGNFGTYIMKDKVTGFLVRWGRKLLTNDYKTWMNPIGVCNFPIRVKEIEIKDRDEAYEKLSENIAFDYKFTGEYTNINKSVSQDILLINKNMYKEIKYAGEKFCEIVEKLCNKIQKNLNIFGEIFGIPKELYGIIENTAVSKLCAIGRIDFCLDNEGKLKMLEFNSETPAGIIEAVGINKFIKDEFSLDYINPNEHLKEKIALNLKEIIREIERKKKIKNIAVVTCWYYEDIYNTNIIAEILKEFKEYNIIFGNVYDLKVKNKEIFLYNEKIDAIYRYYPLDWIFFDEGMRFLIEPLENGDYLINPGHTLITQSKVLFAFMHELIGKGIIPIEDEQFILKYIPYTSMEKDKRLSRDYVIKPYLGREGQDIKMNYEKHDDSINEVVFQDRVNIRPLRIKCDNKIKDEHKLMFPIIGAYITGSEFAGIYTRMGNIITDKNAVYISSFINNK